MPAWKPGESGNKNGRPRGSAGVAQYIRSQCGDDCKELIDRLLELSRDPTCPIRERVGATQHLLDRAIGKAVQTEVQLRLHDGPSLPPGFASWSVQARDIYLIDLRRNALQSGADAVLDVDSVEVDE